MIVQFNRRMQDRDEPDYGVMDSSVADIRPYLPPEGPSVNLVKIRFIDDSSVLVYGTFKEVKAKLNGLEKGKP